VPSADTEPSGEAEAQPGPQPTVEAAPEAAAESVAPEPEAAPVPEAQPAAATEPALTSEAATVSLPPPAPSLPQPAEAAPPVAALPMGEAVTQPALSSPALPAGSEPAVGPPSQPNLVVAPVSYENAGLYQSPGGGQPYGTDIEFQTVPLGKPAKPPRPPRPTPPTDPVAAALGNASLLGVGYFILRRPLFGVLAALVSIGLVVVLASSVRELWFEILIVAWWVAGIAHGWFLASKRTKPAQAGKQRLVALGAALPVLIAFGLLRFDSASIYQDVETAQQEGNCAKALEALDSRWVGHTVANAPLTAKGDDTIQACDLLRQANGNLGDALQGDSGALKAGMARLTTVVNDLPGHDEMVKTTLAGFLGKLPTDNACDTKVITDELGSMKASQTVFKPAKEIVPEIAPKAIVECGDLLMDQQNWSLALERYQQFLEQYPDHDLAGRAQEGVTKATQAIELAKVRGLLQASSGSQPAYCTTPAPYSGAAAYGSVRPNRALFYGNDEYTNRLPAEWKATDAADAVLIVCAGPTEYGVPVETCPYENPLSVAGFSDVTFKRVVIPVQVFEVRTGKAVLSGKVEIGGASCPAVLEYYSPGAIDSGPPSEVYVTPSDPDVHAGFNAMINP
jgi:hypothetical protein